ncbi:MAG: hypothetical protein ACTHK4_10105 [Mycobacteriales bacterium]
MTRSTRRGSAQLLGVVLLSSVVLGSVAPAAAARQASNRPRELGAPLSVQLTPRLRLAPSVGLLPLQVRLFAPTVANPPTNVPPHPNFLNACSSNWHSRTCKREALAAIKYARELEGVRHPTMVLPRNYNKLTVAEQTFVLTDLERVARGLRPFAGLTSNLNTASHSAAVARVDPSPVLSSLQRMGVRQYGSIWAGDFGPLASDYDWMYVDGYSADGSGINVDCQSPQASGCWGHRDNILGKYGSEPTLLAGAGTAKPPGQSIAEVMTGGSGKAPAFTYSWRTARRHGATNR